MFNSRTITKILGFLILLEGLFIILCSLVSLLYKENDSIRILISGIITSIAGGISWIKTRNSPDSISTRNSYLIVTFGWLLFSFFGTIPFFITGAIPSFTDAFFETMSGFTTTGASILNDVESLSHGLLFWRSLTQWLGGMGVILLSLTVLPILGIGGTQLFAAELPGSAQDKLHHHIIDTAKRLLIIYILLTFTESFLLWLGKMELFDAVCHSFSTISTGGFSTKQANVAYWDSPYIQYIFIFFMFFAGTSFTLSYFALHLKIQKILYDEEFRYYLGFVIGFAILFTVVILMNSDYQTGQGIRYSLFQVVSIITTTGFIISDYQEWPLILSILLVVLMLFGGMSRSAGGGIKIMRIMLIVKNSLLELKRITHPNAIIPVRFNNQAVHPEIITSILLFILFYLVTIVAGILVISALGNDLDTSIGAVISCLGNIGPGLGNVGPGENYSNIMPVGKWLLSFLMLTGRLELFTVFVLFTGGFWRK